MNKSTDYQEYEQADKNVLKSPSLAEISLKYEPCILPSELPSVTGPQDAERILREVWDADKIQLREEFMVLLLNTAKKCLGWSKISSGSSSATIVDPATIFQVALLSNATSIILAHNHPSGNLEPSESDKKLTHRIKESGKLLGIQVDDHLIITADSYISFKVRGIL
ncbi:JAB domain-containing protein [Halalkalibaculum sp. DA3122]|uniref:JAB domain-containing protein n=1 Tax=Halalkalibaculum sp. DA3122 TaxID=3373607 RepID=UPI00375438B4